MGDVRWGQICGYAAPRYSLGWAVDRYNGFVSDLPPLRTLITAAVEPDPNRPIARRSYDIPQWLRGTVTAEDLAERGKVGGVLVLTHAYTAERYEQVTAFNLEQGWVERLVQRPHEPETQTGDGTTTWNAAPIVGGITVTVYDDDGNPEKERVPGPFLVEDTEDCLLYASKGVR